MENLLWLVTLESEAELLFTVTRDCAGGPSLIEECGTEFELESLDLEPFYIVIDGSAEVGAPFTLSVESSEF